MWELLNAQPQRPMLLKHGVGVNAAQFSADGHLVLTASLSTTSDSAVQVWDAQTGQPLNKPLRHSSLITYAQFSPEGQRIVTTSLDKTAQVWDARTGNALTKPLEHPASVYCAQFSPDGTLIVTATLDGTAWVWDAATGQPLLAKPLKHGGWLASARFSPDGKSIVTASQDGTAALWDAQSGSPLCRLRRGNNFAPIISAEFSADSKRVLTLSKDGAATVWDARSGELRTQLGGEVMAAQFSPVDQRIVTISAATARVWDAQSGQPTTDAMQHNGTVNSAQFSPDGNRILTAEVGAAQIWDALTGQKLTEELYHGRDSRPNQFRSTNSAPVVRILWQVNSAQFSPDGKRVVTTADDGYARVWDVGPSPRNAPDWLPLLADAISGQILDARGLLEAAPLNRAEVIARLRKELNAGTNNDDWTVWGGWFLSAPALRPISPFCKQNVIQYVSDRIAEKTDDALSAAEQAADDDDALLTRIAEARAKIRHVEEIAALRDRANSCCASGRPEKAISLLEQFCDANLNDTDASLTLAVWQAWFGHDAEYETTRCRLVHQAQGTDQAGTAERAAKAYCIRPSTDAAMLTSVLTLAHSGVELGKNSSLLPWYRLGLGLAQYRNGQFDAAQESLAAAGQTVGDENQDIQGIARFFRAMSLLKQGRPKEARTLFSQEEGRMWPLPNEATKPVVNGSLVSHDVLIWWLAYKEAKSTLSESVAAKP